MKKLLFAVGALFALTLAIAPVVSAQVVDMPAVYVRNITLSSDTYAVGSKVTGSFTLSNDSLSSAGDVSYTVTLLKPNGANKPSSPLDEVVFGPVFLSGNQSEKVDFEYILPQYAAGDLEIEVRAKLAGGRTMGWETEKIKVTGTATELFATVSSLNIAVGESIYEPQAGPMVNKDEKAVLKIAVKNNSKTETSLTPKIVISDYSANNKELKTYNEKAVTVKAGATANAEFDLPLFDYRPGVYAGKIVFYTNSGAQASGSYSFRYIVEGKVATIVSAVSDKDSVKKDEVVSLTVTFTGTPFDISANPNEDDTAASNATLSLELKNEAGKVIGQSDSTISLLSSTQQKTVPITAIESAEALSVDARVVADGKTIATYSTTLSVPKEDAGAQASKDSMMVWAILAVLAVMLVVALVVYLLYRKGVQGPVLKSIVIILAGATAAVSIVTVNAATTRQFPDPSMANTYAYVITPDGITNVTSQTSWCTLCRGLWTTFNDIKDTNGNTYPFSTGSKIKTGVPFVLAGHADYNVCGNFPINPTVKYKVDGGAETTLNLGYGAPGSNGYRSSDFTFNPITFSTPGNHTIHYKFTAVRDYNVWRTTNTPPPDNPNCQNKGRVTDPNSSHYNQYYFLCPATITFEADMTLVASLNSPTNVTATAADCGSASVDVSWGTVPGAATYNVYRSQSENGTYTKINSSPITGTTYRDNNVSSSDTYYYKVEAVNGSNVSDKSAPSGSVEGPESCNLTVALIASPDSSNTGSLSGVDLTANAAGNATGNNTFKFYCNSTNDETIPGAGVTPDNTSASTASNSYSKEDLCSYSTGVHYAKVVVTRGPTSKAAVAQITVTNETPIITPTETPPPTIECAAIDPETGGALTDNKQLVGKPIIWKITAGFETGKQYVWRGTNIGATPLTTNTDSIVKTYTMPGLKEVWVKRSDLSATTEVKCNMPVGNIRIISDPSVIEI